jgi:hypothetical protein
LASVPRSHGFTGVQEEIDRPKPITHKK